MQVENLKVTYPLKNLTKLGNFSILMFVMVIFSLACKSDQWNYCNLMIVLTNCCLSIGFMLLSFRSHRHTKKKGFKSSERINYMTILDSQTCVHQHLLHVTSVIFLSNVKRTTLPVDDPFCLLGFGWFPSFAISLLQFYIRVKKLPFWRLIFFAPKKSK